MSVYFMHKYLQLIIKLNKKFALNFNSFLKIINLEIK